MIKQIKSHWYYVFWGICSVAVVAGQIYVGTGYRKMAEASKNTSIAVTCTPQYIIPKKNRVGEFE